MTIATGVGRLAPHAPLKGGHVCRASPWGGRRGVKRGEGGGGRANASWKCETGECVPPPVPPTTQYAPVSRLFVVWMDGDVSRVEGELGGAPATKQKGPR
jgi:hypothetical protein